MKTAEELIAFEERVKKAFLAAQIRAPIHLSGGNEEEVIWSFRDVKPDDWVFSTYRSHYHALLKGIPEDWLMQEIMAGRSMHINSREYRFFTSAIVGGVLPIALGTAMGIQRLRLGHKSKVWVFVGDMAAESGTFHEVVKYARLNRLPIFFTVEDNLLSVNSPTQTVWGNSRLAPEPVVRYGYVRTQHHVGAGQWVTF